MLTTPGTLDALESCWWQLTERQRQAAETFVTHIVYVHYAGNRQAVYAMIADAYVRNSLRWHNQLIAALVWRLREEIQTDD